MNTHYTVPVYSGLTCMSDADGVRRKRQKIAAEGLNVDCTASSVPLFIPRKLFNLCFNSIVY